MPCAFWREVMKCHIVATKGNLWMPPLQTQLSYWEKSRPHGDAMCTFSSQQSSRTQPSSHCSLETRQMSDGASRWPKLRAWGTPVFGIFPTEALPRHLWSRVKLSPLCPVQNSVHIICYQNKMVAVLCHQIWDSLYVLIDKWTITLVKLASYLSPFP